MRHVLQAACEPSLRALGSDGRDVDMRDRAIGSCAPLIRELPGALERLFAAFEYWNAGAAGGRHQAPRVGGALRNVGHTIDYRDGFDGEFTMGKEEGDGKHVIGAHVRVDDYG